MDNKVYEIMKSCFGNGVIFLNKKDETIANSLVISKDVEIQGNYYILTKFGQEHLHVEMCNRIAALENQLKESRELANNFSIRIGELEDEYDILREKYKKVLNGN